MSVAWFIVLQSKIEGLDIGVNGKALAHAGKVLDPVAEEAGVRSLMHFFSADPEELAEPVESEDISLPPEKWFLADDGLITVRALMNVAENGKVDSADGIVNDLKEFSRILQVARDNGVAWQLAVDF